MRDREQRLRWIEKLIGGAHQATQRSSALVFPTSGGNMAIAFPFIEEVVAADRLSRFAFLPEEFCGVLHIGNELAPVVDMGGDETAPAHIVLVRGKGCLLGLKFYGAPWVADLNETPHTLVEIRFRQKLDETTLPLLNVDTVVETLLAKR